MPEKQLFTYGSTASLTVLGKFEASIEIQNKSTRAEFFVVEEGSIPLLGKEPSEKLGLLKIGLDVNKINLSDVKSRKCFQGMGKLKNFQLSVSINLDVQPVTQPYRRIPILWQKAVEKKA